MTERFKPNITVAGIVAWNDKLLMVEEIVGGQTVYNQPAGHLEEFEGLVKACEREIMEETGIATKALSLTSIDQYQAAESLQFLRFTFHCIVNQYGMTIDPPVTKPGDPKIAAAHWMTFDEIQALESQLRSPLIIKTFKDYFAGNSTPLKCLSDDLL